MSSALVLADFYEGKVLDATVTRRPRCGGAMNA
jgi:hypothetical protein